MKKVLIIGLLLILSGCITVNNESHEEQIINKKINVPVLEKCIKSPPQIYEDDNSSNFLDLCGNKTQFEAIELKEHKAILYAETTPTKQTILRTISTTPPFEQVYIATLPKNYPYFINYASSSYELYYYEENDLYFNKPTYGEMCGLSFSMFIFSPTTKEFVSGGNINEGIVNCGETPLTFISNSGTYTAKDKQFTTATYSECGPASLFNDDEIIKSYANGFPDKIYCFKNIFISELDYLEEPIGYFDLQNDKFVYLDQ